MPVKPIFGSYPFLTIAKKYDVDYGDVLMVAEHHHRWMRMNSILVSWKYEEAYERLDSVLQPRDQIRLFTIDLEKAISNMIAIQTEGWDQS